MDQSEQLKVLVGKEAMDVEFVIAGLKKMYWSGQRSREEMISSFEHSLCFSLSLNSQQIGFARVVSDFSTFAYLCDVFIVEEKRGNGYSKKMLEYIFNYPELKTVKWLLRTKDAHSLYEKFGFVKTERPDRYMERDLS
jgi:GNAT superfamily N-acetyltransferase